MELTDRLKEKDGYNIRSRITFFVAVFSLLLVIMTVIVFIPSGGRADANRPTVQEKMLEIQRDQIEVWKDIATELHKIRIELQKRNKG